MKKYLFLLFLIGVYVLILFNNKDNKTSNVVSYLDKNRDGAISVKINFKDGINSNNLKKKRNCGLTCEKKCQRQRNR